MTLDGTEGPNTLTGTSGDDVINGLGDNDTIVGGAGSDTLSGGSGNDKFVFQAGDGSDVITDLTAGDVVKLYGDLYLQYYSFSEDGLDVTVHLSSGDQITFTNADFNTVRDALSFMPGAAPVYGTEGNDTLTGTAGVDTIIGLGGDDIISGDFGSDTLAGDSGSDTIEGGDGDDVIFTGNESPPPYYSGNPNPPILDTGSEIDTVTAGAGDDVIFAGYGDNVDGGSNYNYGDRLYISFQGANSGVTFDAGLGSQVIGGGTITGIESFSWVEGSNYDDSVNLNGASGYESSVAFGMDGNDTLIGGYYTTLLDGGDGNDVVDGRYSQYLQRVVGGEGDDILYTNPNTFAVADGGAGNDTIYSHAETHGGDGNDTIILSFSYYPAQVSGDGGDDQIIGSDGGDYVFGNDGNDIIDGGYGNDVINGGAGADTLTGGWNYDRFVYGIGDGEDVITDIASGDVVEVRGYTAVQSISQVGSDVVVVFEAGNQITFSNADVATVEGALELVDAPPPQPTEGDDTLNGGSNNDIVDGLGGHDVINGRAGDDTLAGGAGADSLNGGDGNDWLYSGSISPPFNVPPYGSPPVLDQGSEVDALNGGAGNDMIFAGYGDSVDGGDGTDFLYISFQGATEGVTFDFLAGTQTIGGGTITGIEAVDWFEGSNFDDNVNGQTYYSGYYNVIYGMGGNDTLTAGFGTQLVDGGDGDDFITTSGGPQTVVFGGAGNDTIYSYSEAHGGDGNDTIVLSVYYSGSTATGDAGDDQVSGSYADDILAGGTGADVLAGGGGNDRFIYGIGDGVDVITDLASGDVVEVHGYAAVQSVTQDGSDVVVVFDAGNQITFANSDIATVEGALELVDAPPPQPTEGDDTLTGGSGNDIIDGLGGNDTIVGRGGDDTLAGSAGSDQVDGGAGNDTLFSGGISPAYSFPYYGNPYTPPVLDTGSEVDTVNGGAGSDLIFAGYGDDVDGGDDFDQLLISFQGATSGITFDVSLGTQVIGGGTITGIEGVRWVEGSNYDDSVNLSGGYGYDTNVAFGMGGNDTLVAGYYTSLLDGGDGNDILDGSASFYLQRADGGAGDDIIYTNMSPGTIADGGDGNDTIYSANETHGGNGNDTIILNFSYYGIHATGDAGDDTIQGSFGNEVLSGGTGNDLLTGGGADDRFIFRVGDGQDVITDFAVGDIVQVEGYEAFDSIAQVGSDVVLVFASGDQITFQNTDVATVEAGVQLPPVTDDFIIGSPYDDSLNGFGGNDVIAGGSGADIVNGGNGNDDLFSDYPDIYWGGQPDAGLEHDVLNGGAGDDRLTIGYGDDADGGDGVDTLRLSFGGALEGVSFNTGWIVPGQPLNIGGGTIQNIEVLEYLAGSSFNDSLTVVAQDQAITVDGGDGDDWIAVRGGAGAATIYGGAGFDRIDIYGGNVTVYGGDGSDAVWVRDGTAYAVGGSGNDHFVSGSGADTFFGDDGDDRVSYQRSTTGVIVNLSTGATPDGDQLYSIEGVRGSNYADQLTGDWQSNNLNGGDGNDTLDGLDGDDVLDGGAGIDTLTGGYGDDVYVIDNAKDAVIEVENGGTDSVLTFINYTLGKNIEKAQAAGSDEIKLVGNSLDNSLDGNGASNILIGGAGNDILDGREGADTMNGGVGNDYYIVDDAGDKVGENANEGIDEVLTRVSYTLASKVHVETMTAIGGAIDLTGNELAQTLQGNDFDNVLSGGGGNDTLSGWGGSDTLKGGTGNDVLIGGWGDDHFVFEAKAGNDLILDFESGVDKIDLHAFGITMNQVSAVVGEDATVLHVDSNNDGSSDFTITLSGAGAPGAGDYIF